MLLDELLLSTRANWLWYSTVALAILWPFYRYLSNPLRKFKGPPLASFTELWGVWAAWTKAPDPTLLVALHEKYGGIVRLAPNVLSFGQPGAIKDIYSAGFPKAPFYSVAASVSNGVIVPNFFSSTDELYHSRIRRAVSSAYTMTSAMQCEPLVTMNVQKFLKEVDRRFANKNGQDGVMDLPTWMRFFALDGIGEVNHSASYGVVESGKDDHGILAAGQKFRNYSGLNPVKLWLGRLGWGNSDTPTVPFALNTINSRKQLEKQPNHKDLLARFFTAKEEHPESIGDRDVLGMNISSVNAGADTTASTLAAIFYYLVKNPRCLERLQQELEERLPARGPNSFAVLTSFSDAQKLPYLEAVINETFRIHPAFVPIQPRVVPPSGATISGHFIKGGTVVGCSSWVVQRDKGTFGEDVHLYRPERWLDPERAKVMNRAMFQFGGGAHTCLGKNISFLEIYKLVPSFLRTFHISAVDPEKEWKLWNRVFVLVSDFDVRVERRA